MAKRKHSSVQGKGHELGHANDMTSGQVGMRRVMKPNHMGGSVMMEQWSAPALTPRGLHEIEMGNGPRGYKSGRLQDLYEGVEKMLNDDQRSFDGSSEPHSW